MKICSYVIIAGLLLGILVMPASTGNRRKMLSSTKEFLINGRRYILDRSAREETSAGPLFEKVVREVDGKPISPSLPVPKGLLPEHLIELVSDSGPVDLAVGSMDISGRVSRDRLPKTGWERIQLPDTKEAVTVATMKTGKEAFIVFLDEKTSRFLLVRKPE